MQLRHGLYLNDKTNTVASGPSLLALRLGGLSHALEPGRDYLLGSADDCDLRIAGAEPVHARLLVTAEGATVFDLSEATGLLFNEEKVLQAAIPPGDRVGIAGELMVVTADDGTIYTDNDVINTTQTNGFKTTCVQEVGSISGDAALGTRYGPGQRDQVVVLRGDLVNICK